MAAAVTDKFIKGPANKSSTLSSSISDSVQTIPISDLTGVPTDTAVYAAIDAHDSSGTATPSTKEIVKGVVSGSNLINCTRGAEGTAQSHDAGAVVEFFFTAAANNDIVDGITAEHNQDGGHSDIDSDSITNDGTLTQTGVATFADHIDVSDTKAIRDGNDNELVTFSQTASAVNELTVKNAATGNGPEIQATGGDTNIDVEVIPKGTGKLTVGGNPISHGAWTSWTPTYTNITVGDGTVTAKYTQIGKTIHAYWELLCGSTTSISNGNEISLPVAANSNLSLGFPLGMYTVNDGGSGSPLYAGVILLKDANTAQMNTFNYGGNQSVLSTTYPVTEAAGDIYVFSVTYEAA